MVLGKSHFLLILVRAYDLKRERDKIRREEEEGRRKKEKKEKFMYGNYLCKETIERMLVWKFGYFYGTLV